MTGNSPPTCIVRIEEIEKAMAGANAALGDSTGVSQDQLGVLLNEMEENEWSGFVAAGPPGSGKSLISKTIGNTFKVACLNLDLGALKGSYVGQSEQNIRRCMSVIRSFAGKRAFFIATSNKLDIIPPELRRRFRYGIWAFSLPNELEREAIWSINLRKYSLSTKLKKPEDDNWTGADIRNTCELAARLSCSLVEASEFIVPVAKSDPEAIAKFQKAADGRFLSASYPGVYRHKDTDKTPPMNAAMGRKLQFDD